MGKQVKKHGYSCKLVRVVDGDTCDAMIDLGFNVRICFEISLPIEPPAPVMQIILLLIPGPKRDFIGLTFSLPRSSSIEIGFKVLILALPEVKSSMEGTSKIGMLYFLKFPKILFLLNELADGIANKILSIFDFL